MHTRHALALHTQLTIPMIPIAIDIFARTIFLWGIVKWYEFPDLVAFLATYSFFCLGLMFAINPHVLPSDPDATTNVELVKQRLLAIAIISVTFAGGISFMRAISEANPSLHIAEDKGWIIFAVVGVFCGYTFFRICTTYLSYLNRS